MSRSLLKDEALQQVARATWARDTLSHGWRDSRRAVHGH